MNSSLPFVLIDINLWDVNKVLTVFVTIYYVVQFKNDLCFKKFKNVYFCKYKRYLDVIPVIVVFLILITIIYICTSKLPFCIQLCTFSIKHLFLNFIFSYLRWDLNFILIYFPYVFSTLVKDFYFLRVLVISWHNW